MLLQGRKKGKEVTGGTINSHSHLQFPTSNPLTTSNNCTPYRTRTYGLLLRRQLLYPAELKEHTEIKLSYIH